MIRKTVFRSLFILLSAFLLLSGSACVPGGQQGNEGKSCLDCHEDYRSLYTTGQIHKPVKIGDCFGCHRKHGLVGGAYLKQEGAALCLNCHQALANELGEKKQHHDPVAKGTCGVCHQPHNSPNKYLLTKPEEQLCFDCHGEQEFTRKYVHAPLEEGCRTCHEPHGAKVGRLLVTDEAALCKNCHAVGSKAFVEAHGDYPVENRCSDCHSVHSADNPQLLKEFTHQPVSGLECGSCHAVAGSAEPFAVSQPSSSALCYSCHTGLEVDFAASQTHSPVADGDCYACHSPHASDFRGMVKADPQSICFDCHSFKFFPTQKKDALLGYVHAPAREGDCLACHGPHLPGKGQSNLLRKNASQLCVDCHAEKAKQQKVNHQPVTDLQCLGCHAPHESNQPGLLVKAQRPLCAECHQRVGEDLGLQSLHRPFVDGKCSSCHDPHGGQMKQLLRATGAQGCGQCHGTIETERENARHQPFNQGRCELCHRSHGSQQPFLLERPAQEICIECHRDRKPVEGTPGGHQNCSVCHYSHGNDENAFLLSSPPDLCLNCHDVDRFWEKGVAHAPAAEGQCSSCHDPHLPQKLKTTGSVVALCADCHDVDPQTMSEVHEQIAPGDDSCLGCHDPHGGPDASLTLPVKHAPFAKGDCRSCHKEGSE